MVGIDSACYPAFVGHLVTRVSFYLRQRGSTESKPVHASHHATGAD